MDAPAVRPKLAVAARLFLDVDPDRREDDGLFYRHPLLLVMVTATGLYAWKKCGAPWPEDEKLQELIVAGVAGLVVGLLGLVFGMERVAECAERLKRVDVGIMSVPLVLGLCVVVALFKAP